MEKLRNHSNSGFVFSQTSFRFQKDVHIKWTLYLLDVNVSFVIYNKFHDI